MGLQRASFAAHYITEGLGSPTGGGNVMTISFIFSVSDEKNKT